MDVSEIIKQKRKEANITQDQMAKLLNMPRTTYQNIENNLVAMKIYDFFKIVKILNIPLEMFQEEKYIVISQNDFNILKEATSNLKNLADKIESNITIQNNNVVNVTFNNLEKSRKNYCEICGEPSGFFPLCKYHTSLKEKGLIYKDENGHWREKDFSNF